eukprot:3634565-Pyramimonas_sp.AAC.1
MRIRRGAPWGGPQSPESRLPVNVKDHASIHPGPHPVLMGPIDALLRRGTGRSSGHYRVAVAFADAP